MGRRMAKKPPPQPEKPTRKRPARPAAATPKRLTARDRLVSTVERLRAHEARLETMVDAARARLTAALADGAVAAGGFGRADELVDQVLPDRALLGTLRSEAYAAPAPASTFAAYVKLVDDLRALEAKAQKEVALARVSFARLEGGAFRDGGYRSYEDMLDRVLSGLPLLATASLLAEPIQERVPAPAAGVPRAQPSPTVSFRRRLRTWGFAVAALVAVTAVSLVGKRVHAVPLASQLAPVSSAVP